jgi:osmotically inducible protein OsmC
MPTRKANAVWNGSVKEGNGKLGVESGTIDGAAYSFSSRFEDGTGTNPDELIGAALAGCFSMALSMMLGEAGYSPESIETDAKVHLKMKGDDISIPTIELDCTASVSDIDDDEFQEIADKAGKGCPVSKALAGVDIKLNAQLAS